MTTELRADELRRACDPRDIPFDTTADDAPGSGEMLGQARAMEAIAFGVAMAGDGYNVFAIGPHGVGKRTTVATLLEREAALRPVPPDWCLVFDFADPRRPRALRMPPGMARRLRAAVQAAVAELRIALPNAFESDEYRSRKQALEQRYTQLHADAFEALARSARERSVAVVRTETGIIVASLSGDEIIEPQAFVQLPEAEKAERNAAMARVGDELTAMFQRFHDWTREHAQAMRALDLEIATAAAHRVFEGVRAGLRDAPSNVGAYLDELERDTVENADRFLAKQEAVPEAIRRALQRTDENEDRFRRYDVNVLVDHTGATGAPVVYEDNPTHANLIGRIDQVAELGALVTELALIRPGALHRANGGYLVLDALHLVQQPAAWEGLKRALRSHKLRIESLGQALGVTGATLEPEAIPLDVKVVVLGDRDLYYLLSSVDPEVADLFKVVADFAQDVDRDAASESAFARLVANLVRREQLRPFDRHAVARIVEHASRLAADSGKLSVQLRAFVDLLREADHGAAIAGRSAATAEDVQGAIDARERRTGRLRERMLEAVRRGDLLITTSGSVVGQVNGLSIIELEGHAFGHPTRITARARMGDGALIDIEREVELGGPIHSKGVLILAGLIGARYTRHVPLSVSATLVFEQSYGEIEGDSASLAELCALLSAISDVPLRQSYAITGSVNQLGEVQPIGGVNEKIEGFFDACAARGLTGEHGVVIPRANLRHLMLRRDVVAAVAAGKFHVHAVRDVDEALALLAGHEAGVRDREGRYPDGSVNALVEARLTGFAEDVRRFVTGGPSHPRMRAVAS